MQDRQLSKLTPVEGLVYRWQWPGSMLVPTTIRRDRTVPGTFIASQVASASCSAIPRLCLRTLELVKITVSNLNRGLLIAKE
jgi:hypothetical protein